MLSRHTESRRVLPAFGAAGLVQTLTNAGKETLMFSSTDPAVNAEADQIEMENATARRLASHNRFFFRDKSLVGILDHAIKSIEDDTDLTQFGVAAIVKCPAYFTTSDAHVFKRDGTNPVPSRGMVKYCAVCSRTVGRTVPFWVARAQLIVQLDACDGCAAALMDRGAVPQLGIDNLEV
jgi:hypothetical protein